MKTRPRNAEVQFIYTETSKAGKEGAIAEGER